MTVAFSFSLAPQSAYEATFRLYVYDCPMIVTQISPLTKTDVIPMSDTYTMTFVPQAFQPISECIFNLLQLKITDTDGLTMEVNYELNLSNKWIRSTLNYSATPNKLDFIFDDFEPFEVVFDKTLIDSKGVAFFYHGNYRVLI